MKKWRVKCMSINGSVQIVSSHLRESSANQKKREEEKKDPHSTYWVNYE